MKKTTLLLAFTVLLSTAFAQTKHPVKKTTVVHTTTKPAPVVARHQDESFSVQDKNFLDPGIGLGTYYKGLPFGASFEHGFTDKISAGVFVNYSGYNYPDAGYKLNITYFGVRASYHFAELFNVTDPKF